MPLGTNIYDFYKMTKEESETAIKLQRLIKRTTSDLELNELLKEYKEDIDLVGSSQNKGLMEGIESVIENKRKYFRGEGEKYIFDFLSRV